MKHFVPRCYQYLLVVLVCCCSHTATNAEPKPADEKYQTIEWTDLIPADDLEALYNPPSYVTDVEEGSEFEDQLANDISSAIAAASDDRYQQALVSTDVVESFDQKTIRIAGFIAPLDFDDDMNITEFFLVPYFGACLHLPPPPPNQIIYVSDSKGLSLDQIYTPFWVSGTLSTKLIENDAATSAYTMTLEHFEIYDVDSQASIQANKASPNVANADTSSVIISSRLSG